MQSNTETIQICLSRNKISIRLTYKRWAHIVEAHDYMSGNLDLVFESIEDPDYIVKGWTDELLALKHYKSTSISEKYVVVIYKEQGTDGFIITSFMTSSHEKLIKRGIIWQK